MTLERSTQINAVYRDAFEKLEAAMEKLADKAAK
jgi:hypothetical protein